MNRNNNSSFKITTNLLSAFLLIGLYASAQSMPEVSVNGHDASSWFANNWLWIAGFVVLLLIVIFAMSSSSRRKTSTTVSDNNGNINRSSTTTEIVD